MLYRNTLKCLTVEHVSKNQSIDFPDLCFDFLYVYIYFTLVCHKQGRSQVFTSGGKIVKPTYFSGLVQGPALGPWWGQTYLIFGWDPGARLRALVGFQGLALGPWWGLEGLAVSKG